MELVISEHLSFCVAQLRDPCFSPPLQLPSHPIWLALFHRHRRSAICSLPCEVAASLGRAHAGSRLGVWLTDKQSSKPGRHLRKAGSESRSGPVEAGRQVS